MNPVFTKFDLTGKTALITGGATGIGYEMAKTLAQCGAKVMICARREQVLKDATEKLLAEPCVETVVYRTVDLMDTASIQALTDHVISLWGGVDIFIGNAGALNQESIEDISSEAMEQDIRVSLIANIELTRNFMPYMRKKKWGRFIYSSSTASIRGMANDHVSVYAAAKAGLNTFTQYVAAEGGRDGITANALIIGNFLTDMARQHIESFDDEARREYEQGLISMICLGRSAVPEEIGGLVQLLASDAGSYITAATIPIDGGITSLQRPNPL